MLEPSGLKPDRSFDLESRSFESGALSWCCLRGRSAGATGDGGGAVTIAFETQCGFCAG